MEQCQLIKLALLGNKEAAKRLTDAGVLVPCPCCGGEMRVNRTLSIEFFWTCCTDATCGVCGPGRNSEYEARLAWNTRAPILSAEEMEMLDAKD